jgi:hypothetical protein
VASPFSALVALAMAHAGARGETADIMGQGLHIPKDYELACKGFGELIAKLQVINLIFMLIRFQTYKCIQKGNFCFWPVFSDLFWAHL